ncbi:1,2-phenylacetyl-CoA epoxidase subunit PaaD [Flexibacterium corallicola]|uniref:1,2-phenylacetyl-CoA epoxidase subunit PaaD n=1 Tax=Flexibacterium corallicola TaxID=3037259 RepID=UPI003862162E
MTGSSPCTEQILEWLHEVPDPEIPVISIMDLGIVRGVFFDGQEAIIEVTPTYSGCPATSFIELSIETHLRAKGIKHVQIKRRLSPAWTSEWLSTQARRKLKDFGIAPPKDGTAIKAPMQERAGKLLGKAGYVVECPRCGSVRTERVSQFGSTPCKAAYCCTDCLEPFDYFKCI